MSRDLDALASELPIAAILPDVLEAVRTRDVVIEAPPGAGKTTIIPLALLERGVLGDGTILVLQPRRLAARLSALRVASLLGEPLGERVGYRVRFESSGSARTKLWFLTEGVLLRRLRDDPELAGVDAVILDEFHERQLDADLALALLKRIQSRRPLRLIVMSATLDAGPVASFLDHPAHLRTEGRSFPVEIEYKSPRSRSGELPLERQVAAAVRELVERKLIGDPNAPGHALVFLPGAREIRACAEQCASLAERAGLELLSLHGQLSREQQDRVVERSTRSKLILSTNVAETSITIDGVVAVIDSGLARIADFDPGSGLPRLSLAPISRASAAQRAGRAGRTRAGVCIRLYGRHDHDHRPEHQLAEIRRLELAGPVLELAAAGVREPEKFEWFEPPPPASLAAAQTLLRQLGAIDERGALTESGRAMLSYPLHPRLARLLVAGAERGVGELAAAAAAILAERPLRTGGPPPRTSDADILDELELLERGDRGLDPAVVSAVRRATDQLRRLIGKQPAGPRSRVDRELALRQALLAAHPDRVASVRVDDHGHRTLVFAFGGSAELSPESAVRSSAWVIALRSEERREGTRRRAVVRSACAIDPEWLIDLFPEAVIDDEQLRFDPARERVIGESALRYGKLAITASPITKLPEAASQILLEAARNVGVQRFCGDELEQLRLRAAFVHAHRPELPLLDDARIDEALTHACAGKTSFAELQQANLPAIIQAELGMRAGDPTALDRLAPRTTTLPGGRKLDIHYEADRPPWVGSWLQDFFGLRTGPRVLDGKIPVVLHLRAPNRHDVAVTTDLAAFWRDHYPELRKRLSRRYPRHDWPDDPLTAKPPAPSGRKRAK